MATWPSPTPRPASCCWTTWSSSSAPWCEPIRPWVACASPVPWQASDDSTDGVQVMRAEPVDFAECVATPLSCNSEPGATCDLHTTEPGLDRIPATFPQPLWSAALENGAKGRETSPHLFKGFSKWQQRSCARWPSWPWLKLCRHGRRTAGGQCHAGQRRDPHPHRGRCGRAQQHPSLLRLQRQHPGHRIPEGWRSPWNSRVWPQRASVPA